jgi:hypothetical protein
LNSSRRKSEKIIPLWKTICCELTIAQRRKNRSWRVLLIDTHMTIIDLLPYTIHNPTISTLRKGRLRESIQRNRNLLLPCHKDFDPDNWVDVMSIVAAAD